MPVTIDVQTVSPDTKHRPENQVLATSLLPRAIPGVETSHLLHPTGVRRLLAESTHRARVFFFFAGAGKILSQHRAVVFTEPAVLATTAGLPLEIESASGGLEYLEIALDLTAHEFTATRKREDFFLLYSRCEAYGEDIKSASTESRTIIPPGVLPRFCMGSVQATGPDEVGAHAHPVLDQLFWGLPANDCLVIADRAEARFGERTLLHVSLGSHHGVKVERGKTLHYLWMDFFTREEDLAYIHQQHRPTRK